jgi:hypothetical protein
MAVSKTRASFLNGEYIKRPDAELGRKILEWCGHIDPAVTEFDLRALARYGNTDKIGEYSAKTFGVGPRNLSPEDFHKLRQAIERGDHMKGAPV